MEQISLRVMPATKISTHGCTSTRPFVALSEPRFIALAFHPADVENSVLCLVYTLFPEWRDPAEGKVEFSELTEGKTNLILKVALKRPMHSQEEVDQDSVLIRVYGDGTNLIADREREWRSHAILACYNLASPLLARFENGLIYRFTIGRVCDSADLRNERVWRGVARKLGEWHAVLPTPGSDEDSPCSNGLGTSYTIWQLMQKWISVLPNTSPKEKERKIILQVELNRLIEEFSDIKGLDSNPLVFGHCDLLGPNVVIQPPRHNEAPTEISSVTFIDYEYAVLCPAAFDISNHFAEWAGFECNYDHLPTRTTRRAFLAEYVRSYYEHFTSNRSTAAESVLVVTDLDVDVQKLFVEVDRFRGVPGFFWSICALIRASGPQTDFDFSTYANSRLAEYWAWRATEDGTRDAGFSIWETRWAQEE